MPVSRAVPLRVQRSVMISGHGVQLTGGSMTTFDNREKAFEDKFAYDAETAFRIAARRNRLLGLWAAEQMKLTPEEADAYRSEEHTSELQSLMRISYAVFCLKKKKR